MHHSPWELWANRAVIYSQGGGLPNPQNTQSFPHTAHNILFRVFAFAALQPSWLANNRYFIVKKQVLVFIIIYMFANKWLPDLLWFIHGNMLEEFLKGHFFISMNSILEVISICLFLVFGYV